MSKTLRRREALAATVPPPADCSGCLGIGDRCQFSVPCAAPEPSGAPAAEPPRLRIERDPITGRWCWWVAPFPTKTLGHAATHAEALAVGLAALETASVRTRT